MVMVLLYLFAPVEHGGAQVGIRLAKLNLTGFPANYRQADNTSHLPP
jgi:hypothetical protein